MVSSSVFVNYVLFDINYGISGLWLGNWIIMYGNFIYGLFYYTLFYVNFYFLLKCNFIDARHFNFLLKWHNEKWIWHVAETDRIIVDKKKKKQF